MKPGVRPTLSQLKAYCAIFARNVRVDYLASGECRAQSLQQKLDWERDGRVGPTPHCIKEEEVRAAARTNGIRTLVETGTYLGDMVDAVYADFACIHSIELSRGLYLLARLRFLGRRRVHLVHGDSFSMLRAVLEGIHEPCVFWLDGHDSGGITGSGVESCPILAELSAIFSHDVRRHVILIDDACMFEGSSDDFPTLDSLTNLIMKNRPASRVHVENDIVHVTLSG